MLHIRKIVTGNWHENCYLVKDNLNNAILIDPGNDAEAIIDYIESNKLELAGILNTHAHYDHIGAVEEIKRHFLIPFYLHSKDLKLLKSANLYGKIFDSQEVIKIPNIDYDLKTMSQFRLTSMNIEIIETPGHTEGGVCILIDQHLLFTGDTLFYNNIGRLDLPGGNRDSLMESLKKLAKLNEDIMIFPGHKEHGMTLKQVLLKNEKFREAISK